jgi:hypothetical protein
MLSMADPQTLPVLDLTTDQSRPLARIDGVEYQIRTSRDLTLSEYFTFQRIGPRVLVLMSQSTEGALPADEEKEFTALLNQMCSMALMAPPEVLARLDLPQRLHLFNLFTDLLTPRLRAPRVATAEASPVHGPKSSPPSRGSTRSTRRSGRTSSRSAPSART